jgi:methylglutaconyl-CoA hydratase
MDQPTSYEVARGVATITLDAPQRRNAFSQDLLAGVLEGLRRAVDDHDVRVVVLTNTGTTFSAGADLKEDRAALGSAAKSFLDVAHAVEACPKPVVARVCGHAAGGAVAVVAACDHAVAVDTARIGITEVRLGIAPVPVAELLARRLTPRALSEAFLVADMMPAARAAELGLVNLAVPAEQLDEAVERFVAGLVRGGPTALAATKRVLAVLGGRGDGAAREGVEEGDGETARQEAREGVAAFLEKRPPAWVPS